MDPASAGVSGEASVTLSAEPRELSLREPAAKEESKLYEPETTLSAVSNSRNCGEIFLQQHLAGHEDGRGARPGVQEAGFWPQL